MSETSYHNRHTDDGDGVSAIISAVCNDDLPSTRWLGRVERDDQSDWLTYSPSPRHSRAWKMGAWKLVAPAMRRDGNARVCLVVLLP